MKSIVFTSSQIKTKQYDTPCLAIKLAKKKFINKNTEDIGAEAPPLVNGDMDTNLWEATQQWLPTRATEATRPWST